MTKTLAVLLLFLTTISSGQSRPTSMRAEAEYYASAYAHHYRVPVRLVRSTFCNSSL